MTVRATSKYRDSSSRTASRVPRFRQRGEPDHVAEQHRAHPPLRHRVLARPGNGRGSRGRRYRGSGRRERRAAGTAKALTWSERLTARRAHADRRAAIPTETVALSHGRTALPARHATVLTLVCLALSRGSMGGRGYHGPFGQNSRPQSGTGRTPAAFALSIQRGRLRASALLRASAG